MLLKQQKANPGDGFDLSSLTLEEPSSPVEEVVTNTSSTKVSLKTHLFIQQSCLTILYVLVMGSNDSSCFLLLWGHVTDQSLSCVACAAVFLCI